MTAKETLDQFDTVHGTLMSRGRTYVKPATNDVRDAFLDAEANPPRVHYTAHYKPSAGGRRSETYTITRQGDHLSVQEEIVPAAGKIARNELNFGNATTRITEILALGKEALR